MRCRVDQKEAEMAYLIGFIVTLFVVELIKSTIEKRHDRIGKRPWAPWFCCAGNRPHNFRYINSLKHRGDALTTWGGRSARAESYRTRSGPKGSSRRWIFPGRCPVFHLFIGRYVRKRKGVTINLPNFPPLLYAYYPPYTVDSFPWGIILFANIGHHDGEKIN